MKDFSRKLFVGVLGAITIIALFSAGIIAQYKDLPITRTIERIYETLNALGKDPIIEHLQPTYHSGSGVVVNARPDDGAQILLSGFFEDENQIRLIRRDGSLVRKWSLNYLDLFPSRADRPCKDRGNLDVDVHGVALNTIGELVFNFEYCGTVKLDWCGKPVWTLNEKTHHAISKAENGGYWILSRDIWPASEDPQKLPPFSTPGTDDLIFEDYVIQVDEAGKILDTISIPLILIANDLDPQITSNNLYFNNLFVTRNEIVHSNQVTELTRRMEGNFPLFEAGDLAVSLRGTNLVVVFDPVTRRVKWHQTGPWLRQHDVEFRADGKLSIFNNNSYFTGYRDALHVDLDTPRSSNIMAIDPTSRDVEIVYGNHPGEDMLSVIRGQHTLLGNGGMLITEFDGGRVFEIDANRNTVWEFINRYDENWVGEITSAHLFEDGYLTPEGTPCD
jgi:hypothetical protein